MPARAQLLDLPDDALAAIFRLLPFLDRLRLQHVCARFRGACAGASPVWREVAFSKRLRRQGDAPEDRDALATAAQSLAEGIKR